MNTTECGHVVHYNTDQLRSQEPKSIFGHVPGHRQFDQFIDPLPAESGVHCKGIKLNHS